MSLALLPLGALLAIGGALEGGASLFSGFRKKKQANDLQAQNVRPQYTIPNEVNQNVDLAESMASQGLSSQAKDYYQNQANRGLTANIDAILKGGGDVNTIGSNYSKYLDGMSSLALADDQRRLQNLKELMNQRQNLADYRDREFNINKYSPYVDMQQRIAALRTQGEQQQWSGLNTITSGLLSGANNYMQQKYIDALSRPQGNYTPTDYQTQFNIENRANASLPQFQQMNPNLSTQDAITLNNLFNGKYF